mmetsp:Transcript_35047/g.105662  ORF Transcript_35047/g.105662 Transcript_35047/m.105662 type:complete len:284 (+) Transcript_35047:992-1843(+)
MLPDAGPTRLRWPWTPQLTTSCRTTTIMSTLGPTSACKFRQRTWRTKTRPSICRSALRGSSRIFGTSSTPRDSKCPRLRPQQCLLMRRPLPPRPPRMRTSGRRRPRRTPKWSRTTRLTTRTTRATASVTTRASTRKTWKKIQPLLRPRPRPRRTRRLRRLWKPPREMPRRQRQPLPKAALWSLRPLPTRPRSKRPPLPPTAGQLPKLRRVPRRPWRKSRPSPRRRRQSLRHLPQKRGGLRPRPKLLRLQPRWRRDSADLPKARCSSIHIMSLFCGKRNRHTTQ